MVIYSFSTHKQATIVTLTDNLKDIVHDTHNNASKADSSMESIIKYVGSYIRADERKHQTNEERKGDVSRSSSHEGKAKKPGVRLSKSSSAAQL